MAMLKRFVPLSSLVLALAACSQTPLTETECRTLANKELDYALSNAPDSERESMRSFLTEAIDAGVQRCVAGQTYNRDDYECMIRTADPTATGECIREAAKHIRR